MVKGNTKYVAVNDNMLDHLLLDFEELLVFNNDDEM